MQGSSSSLGCFGCGNRPRRPGMVLLFLFGRLGLLGRVTTLLSFAVLRFHVLWFRNMHRQNNITLFRNINLVFSIIDEQTVLTCSTTVVLSSLTLRAIQSHSRRPSGRNAELEKAY